MNLLRFALRARPLALLASVTVAACSSSAGSAGGESVRDQCNEVGASYCTHMISDCLVQGATAGSQCNEVAQALCAAETSCGPTPPSDCVQQAVQACCGGAGRCNDPVMSTEASIQGCTNAIAANACSAAAGSLPAECTQVIQATGGVDDCESVALQACCGNAGGCDTTATSSQSAVDSCSQQLAAMACGAGVPGSCRGVITNQTAAVRVHPEREARASTLVAVGRMPDVASWGR
jgi:hypothetical protein